MKNVLVCLAPRTRRSRTSTARATPSSAAPRELSGVSRFPVEIWQYIALFLPAESEAALAFTCHSMASILTNASWLELKRRTWSYTYALPENRLAFLRLLDDTLPDHFVCHKCCIYHNIYSRKNPRGFCHGPYPCCSVTDFGCMGKLYFSDVQLELRAHRLGRQYGSKIPRFDKLQSSLSPPGFTYWMDTAIVDGKLLLRHVSSVVFDDRDSIFDQQQPCRFSERLGMCWHYPDYGHGIQAICHCATSHYIQQEESVSIGFIQCTKCLPLRRCYGCASEYLVRIERVYPSRCRLILYRWSDLGDGRDPCSREWPRSYPDKPRDSSDLPSVRVRFEASQGREAPDEQPEPWYVDSSDPGRACAIWPGICSCRLT